jgi:hypothetical protein
MIVIVMQLHSRAKPLMQRAILPDIPGVPTLIFSRFTVGSSSVGALGKCRLRASSLGSARGGVPGDDCVQD